jgi:hypothetical protein
VTISAAPRLLLAAGTLPEAARAFIWSDALATYVDRLAGGTVPYFGGFFEYPPLIGYVAGALVRTTTGPVAYVATWAAIDAVAAAIVALIVAREAGAACAIALWSCSPQLLLYGAANFDALGIALLVAGVTLSRSGRPIAALPMLALGALVKAFPAAAAPFVVDALRRERGLAVAAGGAALFAAVAVILAAPALVAPHPLTESAGYLAGLTNFDSAWGLVLAGLEGAGVPGAPAIVVLASAAGTIVTYAVALRRGARSADPARSALLGLLAVLLWSRLYSPQYSLWVLPFFALVALPRRAFALLAAADVAVFATVYPLTLVPWAEGDAAPTVLFAVLATAVVLRHAALVRIWMVTDRPRAAEASA